MRIIHATFISLSLASNIIPMVTKHNFLLTISIDSQEQSLWELIKWSQGKNLWSFIKFSQLILQGNVWRSVWRICMWILGPKGLKVFTVFYFVLPYGEKKSFRRFSKKQLTDVLHLKLFSRQNLFFKTSASDLYSLNIFKISQISAWIDF